MLDRLSRQISIIAGLRKASPVAYMGPDRQLYVDPEHTQAWHPDYSQHSHARIQAMAEMARVDADRQKINPQHRMSSYHYDVLKEKGVQIHPSVDGSTPPPQPKIPRDKALFHSTPADNMPSIKAHGLLAARGGRTWGGVYENHSKGKVFLSSTASAASQWHDKTVDAMESKLVGRQRLGKNPVVMLRVKDRPVEADAMPGGLLGSESHFTTSNIPPEDLEFYHGKTKQWMPIQSWRPGAHALPDDDDDDDSYFPTKK
jgi:hypothetical protein